MQLFAGEDEATKAALKAHRAARRQEDRQAYVDRIRAEERTAEQQRGLVSILHARD